MLSGFTISLKATDFFIYDWTKILPIELRVLATIFLSVICYG